MQAAQQMTVTGAKYAVYICTTEVGVLFKFVLYCPTDMLDVVRGCLFDIGNRNVAWEYTSAQSITELTFSDDEETAASQLPFGTVANDHVSTRGPMDPV